MKKSNLPAIQLYPADSFKIAIDNLTRKAFELCLDGESNLNLSLKESFKKDIKSDVIISNLDKLKINFYEFHWAVFDACVSEIKHGNEYTTLAILRRKFGGDPKHSTVLDKAIKDALEDLALIRISVDMNDTKKFYDSPTNSGTYKFSGYILANESLDMSVNGQDASIIHFTRRSILFVTSEMKDQIITCNPALLNPPVRATPRSISINHFFLRRVLEMKGSHDAAKSNKRVKPLRNTILFNSLYKACNLEFASLRAKQNARNIAVTVLDFFVEKGLINGYSIETGNAGKARAIIIEL